MYSNFKLIPKKRQRSQFETVKGTQARSWYKYAIATIVLVKAV